MNKFLLSIFIFLFCQIIQAAPYSHLADKYPEGQTDALVSRLLTNHTIRYCILIPEEENEFLSSEQADTLIQVALREWTHGIALRIAEANRAEEFHDIITLLEQPLHLLRQPQCNTQALPLWQDFYNSSSSAPKTDIMFVFSNGYCGYISRAPAFYSFNEGNPFICANRHYENPLRLPTEQDYFPEINIPDAPILKYQGSATFQQAASGSYDSALQKKLWAIEYIFMTRDSSYFSMLIHETGHAFGLADEYLEKRAGPYKSRKRGEGVMQIGYGKIGCDEIDGIITLIDRQRGIRRTFTSFCPGRNSIVNGKEISPQADYIRQTLHRFLSR